METLTNVYLRMMMVDGFMHADPHPGNLLVQDDGTLVVLDWGAVLEVPRWTRESILERGAGARAGGHRRRHQRDVPPGHDQPRGVPW